MKSKSNVRPNARLFPAALLAAAIVAVAVPMQAFGQVLEEITVTAQRRAQNLQDVPISVTAFSGDMLQQNNITSAHEYLALTPNVSFTEDGQSGSRGLGIAIRGINNIVSGENAFINSIGMYMDEFSVASVPNAIANPHLPDMEAVEILRGPQGTLFGRNSLGGTLNLRTRKPVDIAEGEVLVGAETYDGAGEQYNLTGIVNVPISDTFQARGVFYYADSSGFVSNACATGANLTSCPGAAENNFTPNGAKDSGVESLMLRLNLAWQASDSTDVGIHISYAKDDQGHDENVPAGVLDVDTIDTFGNTGAVDPGTGFWYQGNQNRLSHDLQEHVNNEALVAILTVDHQVNDDFSLKWITGYMDAELNRKFDQDLVGGADSVRRDNLYEGTSWSTELRGRWQSDSMDFVLGAMYAKDDQKQDNLVSVSTQALATINGTGFLPPFPEGLGLAKNKKSFEVGSLAIFADLTWHLNDRTDLILGARYTDDTVTNSRVGTFIAPTTGFQDGAFVFFQSFQNFAADPLSSEQGFSDISPRAVLKYNTSDTSNIYASISKGYKAGGTALGNAGTRNLAKPFKEETLINYELGFKAEFADNTLRLNGAIFFIDWSDFQLESFRFLIPGDLSSNFEDTINISSAEATGAELELVWAASEAFTLSGGVGYLDAEIKSDEIAEITGGFLVALQGLTIPKAPEVTASLAGEYVWDVDGNDAWVRLEWIHRDGQFSDIEALTYAQTDGPSPNQGLARNSIAEFGDYPFRTPDYDVINLRAGYTMENWRVIVYVQNLTEEEYFTGTQENFGASGFRLRPHPRVIGGTIGYRW